MYIALKNSINPILYITWICNKYLLNRFQTCAIADLGLCVRHIAEGDQVTFNNSRDVTWIHLTFLMFRRNRISLELKYWEYFSISYCKCNWLEQANILSNASNSFTKLSSKSWTPTVALKSLLLKINCLQINKFIESIPGRHPRQQQGWYETLPRSRSSGRVDQPEPVRVLEEGRYLLCRTCLLGVGTQVG